MGAARDTRVEKGTALCGIMVSLGEHFTDVIAYLKEHDINTMGEIVDNIGELPEEYMVKIKAKLVFGIEDY